MHAVNEFKLINQSLRVSLSKLKGIAILITVPQKTKSLFCVFFRNIIYVEILFLNSGFFLF